MCNVVHLIESYKTKLGDHTGNQYSQLNTFHDSEYKISWFLMSGDPRPCFTPHY